jgi:dTDP-4-dehydrorhamnose reductase
MNKANILLFGATGQLGVQLKKSLSAVHRVITIDRSDCDLSRPDEVYKIAMDLRPQAIVNAAAYTAVDRAESDIALATAINSDAPAYMAKAAEKLDIPLVHYSTDYVFDGNKEDPYLEIDPPSPLSVYGKTKYNGENAIISGCKKHVIFRTSWVFSPHGSNFPKTILRLAQEREVLKIVSDQFGAPTHTSDIANATTEVLSHLLYAKNFDPRFGLYHLSSQGKTNWHEFAVYVVMRAIQHGFNSRILLEKIEPIGSAQNKSAARRPKNSTLLNDKLLNTFGIKLQNWQPAVDSFIDELYPKML